MQPSNCQVPPDHEPAWPCFVTTFRRKDPEFTKPSCLGLMKPHRPLALCRVIAAFLLCLFAPVAMAHDIGNVLMAYGLVLAIPVPALLALVGWKWALAGLIPLWALALWFANSGNYAVMYALLCLPYAVWLARAASRRIQRPKHEA
jgi:hypothetical protein